MLEEWRETVTGYFDTLEPLHGTARNAWTAAGGAARRRRRACERAEKNLGFLRDGGPSTTWSTRSSCPKFRRI
jgi:hypothetical protein